MLLNEPVNCSHCVYLKLRNRFHALLTRLLWPWRYCPFKVIHQNLLGVKLMMMVSNIPWRSVCLYVGLSVCLSQVLSFTVERNYFLSWICGVFLLIKYYFEPTLLFIIVSQDSNSSDGSETCKKGVALLCNFKESLSLLSWNFHRPSSINCKYFNGFWNKSYTF